MSSCVLSDRRSWFQSSKARVWTLLLLPTLFSVKFLVVWCDPPMDPRNFSVFGLTPVLSRSPFDGSLRPSILRPRPRLRRPVRKIPNVSSLLTPLHPSGPDVPSLSRWWGQVRSNMLGYLFFYDVRWDGGGVERGWKGFPFSIEVRLTGFGFCD